MANEDLMIRALPTEQRGIGGRIPEVDSVLDEHRKIDEYLDLPDVVALTPKEYALLSYSLADLDPVQRDERKYMFGSAVTFSRNMGIPLEQAVATLPALTKAQLGIEYRPDFTTFRSVVNSFKVADLSPKLTKAYDDWMDIYMAGGDTSEAQARIDDYQSQIEQLQDDAPRWITTKLLKMTIENLPYMADTFMTGVSAGLAARIAAEPAIAAARAAGAPGLVLGEMAGAAVGAGAMIATIARVWKTKEWTAGEQFYELVNQGADPNMAYVLSNISGVIQGLIEESGGPMTSLNKALGLAGKGAGEFSSKVAAYLYLKGKTGKFARGLIRYGLDIGAEGLEEVQQQFVDDVTDAITYTLSDMEIPEGNWTTPREYAEAFVGGVGVAAILGIAPSIATSRIEASNARTINELARTPGLSEGTFMDLARSLLPEDLRKPDISGLEDTGNVKDGASAGESVGDRILKTVYRNNEEARQQNTFNREGIWTRMQESASDDQENASPTPAGSGEVSYIGTGRVLNIAYNRENELYGTDGWTRNTATVQSADGKERYGDIVYLRRGRDIRIQTIDLMAHPNYQTEEFRDRVLTQFASSMPEYRVEYDTADPNQIASRDRVIAANPRGSQYGLNYGDTFDADDRAAVEERIQLFNLRDEELSAAATLVQMLGAAEGKTGAEFFDSRFAGTITEEEFRELYPEYRDRELKAAFVPGSRARLPERLRGAADVGGSVRGILVAGRSNDYSSFEHEVVHALMQDREKQDSFSDVFASEIQGQDRFWSWVHSNPIYKGDVKANFDYIEAHPEAFAKGAQWGTEQHEFVARLEEMYRTSGQSTRPELRSFFQRLTDFFRRIYGALKGEGALSDAIVEYFDSFFGTAEDLRRSRQGSAEAGSQQSIGEVLTQEPVSPSAYESMREILLSDPSLFDAEGRHLAPNGQPSNLTLEQWITVRTPEFKAWFGDWELDPENASKVVDGNGEPLVVYHGTGARFSEFSYDELGSREGSFFFAQNLEDAQGYASGIVMPVFLNLRNPISFNDIPAEVFDSTEDKAGMVEWSKQNGYDGWMTDMDTGWGELSAFYPSQIKSAVSNSGAFSPDTGNIYFQGVIDTAQGMRDAAASVEDGKEEAVAEYLRSIGMDIPASEIVVLSDDTVIIKDDPGADYGREHLEAEKSRISESLAAGESGSDVPLGVRRDLAGVPSRGIYPAEFTPGRGWSGRERNPLTIKDQWDSFGFVSFIGAEISSPADAVQLYSIYRNPKLEYIHYILTKDGRIVRQLSLTSGLAGSSIAAPMANIRNLLVAIADTDYDNLYVLHNHPSTNVDASGPDLKLAKNLRESLRDKGVIFAIMDHDQYSIVSMDGQTIKYPVPEGYHQIAAETRLSDRMYSPEDVISLYRSNRESGTQLFWYDNQARLMAIEAIDPELALSDIIYRKIAENFYRGAFLVVDDEATFFDLIKRVMRLPHSAMPFQDIILVGNEDMERPYYSARWGGTQYLDPEQTILDGRIADINWAWDSDLGPDVLFQEDADRFNSSMERLAEMPPVATLEAAEFPKADTRLVDRVYEYYQSAYGNTVHRDGLGDVSLSKRGIKDSRYHGLGQAKVSAFRAVPEVIRNGVMMAEQIGYGPSEDRFIIAAPLTIGGEDYICEVVVRRNGRGALSFYLHEVERKNKLLSDTLQNPTFNAEASIREVSPEASKLIISKLFKEYNNNRKQSPILFQSADGQKEAAREWKDRVLSMSDEDFLSVIGRGREYAFNPDLGEGMAELRRIAQLSDDFDQFLAFAEAMREDSTLSRADRRRLRRQYRERLNGNTGAEASTPESIRGIEPDPVLIDVYEEARAERDADGGIGTEGSEATPDETAPVRASDRQDIIEELEDGALRRAMETGEETYGNGEAERIIAESNSTIERVDAEQPGLDAGLADDEDRIKESAPKSGSALTELRKQVTSLRSQLRGIERSIQRRSRNTAQQAQNLYGIEQQTADGERYRTLRQQLNRLIQQQRQLYTRMRQEAVRAGKAAQFERDWARYQSRLEKVEANYKAKLDALREKALAQKATAYKARLFRIIMRDVSANTRLDEARQIQTIQDLMTDDGRKRILVDGHYMGVDELRALYEADPDNPVFATFSQRNLDILTKKTPNDFTVAELEALASAVQELRRRGLREWQAVVDQRNAMREAFLSSLRSTIRKSSHYDDEPWPESDEERRRLSRPWARMWNLASHVINMSRIAQLLDNGQKDGPFYRLLVEATRRVQDAEERAIRERLRHVQAVMKEQGVKPSDLMEKVLVRIGPDLSGVDKTATYTLDELAYIYFSKNNEKNRQAVAYGFLVRKDEHDTLKRESLERYPDSKKDRKAWLNRAVESLGDQRYEAVWEQADAILHERPKVLAVYDAILSDLNSNAFDRVQRVMRGYYNRGITREDFYLPIRRLDWDETTDEKLRAQAMTARHLAEEATKGVSTIRPSLNKGFTESREVISPADQGRIRAGLFSVWMDSVRDEEHLVAALEHSRMLDSVFKDKGLRNDISYTYGRGVLGQIDAFLDEVRNPYVTRRADGLASSLRFLRGNLYLSYLGIRASNIIMQGITSPWPFLGEGVGVAEYMNQLFRYISHPIETWEMIAELSPMMEARSFDLGASLISEEHRAIREQDGPKAVQRARQVLGLFQEWSLVPLDYVDRVAVSAGWLAKYERAMADGKTQEEAVRIADDAVLNSQPVQRRTEMSSLFRTDNEWAKFFTQFTSSLNVVFQNLFFDLPMELRNHEWAKAASRFAGYAIAGALLFAVREGIRDDEDDDGEEEIQWRRLLYSFFSQGVDSVPIVADAVESIVYPAFTGEKARMFFGSDFPPLDRLSRAMNKVVDRDFDKALLYAAESIGLFTGIPTLAIEDYWDAFESVWQGEAPESLWR